MQLFELFGIKINSISENELLQIVNEAISLEYRINITYTHFNTINQLYGNKSLSSLFNQFDYVHPDGIGILIGSKLLLGKDGLNKRITGSDFYPTLLRTAIQNKWRMFFFGDTTETLELICIKNSKLNVTGYIPGYDYDSDIVVKEVNKTEPDILIVGLGQPLQEKWIMENKDNLDVNVLLAVGDGIKVFAGVKPRGSKFIQKIGLEWFVRLIHNPKQYWKRYLIGIPLFIFRVLKEKYKK